MSTVIFVIGTLYWAMVYATWLNIQQHMPHVGHFKRAVFAVFWPIPLCSRISEWIVKP